VIDELQQTAVAERARRSSTSAAAAVLELGLIEDRALAAALAGPEHTPIIDLRNQQVDAKAAELIGAERSRLLDVLAYAADDDGVRVAALDPGDPRLAPVLADLAARGPVTVGIGVADELRTVVNQTFRRLIDVDALVGEFNRTEVQHPEPVTAGVEDQHDVPVVQLVERIIAQAMFDRSSDVHIESVDGVCRVRYRIDGALTEVLRLPLRMAAPIVSRIKILADMSIVERRRPQDGQFTMLVDGKPLDVRVATSSTIWGEKAVLRLLGHDRRVLRLADLGMPPATEARFARLARSAHGMLICSGPTGSGKTTTLYSAIGRIDATELNITTIEDPVESVLAGINQIQISEPAGLTFAVGLRSILRQDPDVILVGEMRDAETTRIAVEAALTGHLVLSSTHATDAAAALVRMADMGIERFRIASSVIGVVGQRLVRRVCRACAVEQTPDQEDLDAFVRQGGDPDLSFQVGEGCSLCSGSGYHGRVGIFEILEMDDELRDLLVAGRPARELRAQAAAAGMLTLADGATDLVASGTTSLAEFLRKVSVH
jgi:type IV pilus assembly protein PilB